MNDLLNTMIQRLDERQHVLARLDRYYRGDQSLAFLSPEAKTALGARLTSLNSNVCKLAVTALAERLRVTGFARGRVPAQDVWAAWTRNDLDQLAGVAHREALALGRAYVTTWADEAGRARVTVESARQVATLHDPGTREIVAAVKKWETTRTTEAVLYEPDRITRFRAPQTGGTAAGMAVLEVLDNPLGQVPVTPIVNGDRLLDVDGVSEMADLLPLVDALTKLLSDLMVGSEFYARPRRWATGVEPVEDAAGNVVNPFPEGDRMMVSESVETKFGSLPAADLAAYESAIGVVFQQISAVSALPAHMLGIVSANLPNADTIRAAEAGLTARAEARQGTFGRAWERVAR